MNIIITGGTKGIGLALLKKMNRKDNVLVVARNVTLTKKTFLKYKNIHFLKADLSSQTGYLLVTNFVKQNWEKVDVIVNNAAILASHEIINTDVNILNESVNTNFISPVLIAVHLRKKLSGNSLIVNILSPAIYRNGPNIWLYVATKRSLHSASQALSQFTPTLMYYPGIINTGIVKERSIWARIIGKEPEYTANKLHSLILKRKTGIYFEPGARLLQFAGILGF